MSNFFMFIFLLLLPYFITAQELQQAEKAFSQGQFEQVISYLGELYQQNALTMEGELLLAKSYRSLGRLRNSIKVENRLDKREVKERKQALGILLDLETKATKKMKVEVYALLSEIYLSLDDLESCKKEQNRRPGKSRYVVKRENREKAKIYAQNAIQAAKNFSVKEKTQAYHAMATYKANVENNTEAKKYLNSKSVKSIVRQDLELSLDKLEFTSKQEAPISFDELKSELKNIWNLLSHASSRKENFSLIRFAYLLETLKIKTNNIENSQRIICFGNTSPYLNISTTSLLSYRFQSLIKAFKLAKGNQDVVSEGYASLELAKLYREQMCFHKAEQLVREAILKVKAYPLPNNELWGYPQLIYQLYREWGKISKKMNYPLDEIIKHYEKADYYAGLALRIYNKMDSKFKKEIEGFYLEFTDLILRKARMERKFDKKQSLLADAIDKMESLKVIELKNFYQDECLDQKYPKLEEELPLNSLLYYPIIFKDRIEHLVMQPSYSKKYVLLPPTHIDREELKVAIGKFRENIGDYHPFFNDKPYKSESKKVYDKLIKPLEKAGLLLPSKTTLAIIPHEFLYKLPFAALCKNDCNERNNDFLIQNYSIAVIPARQLTAFSKLKYKRDKKVLMLESIFTNNEKCEYEGIPKTTLKPIFDKQGYKIDSLSDIHFKVTSFQDKLKNNFYPFIHFLTHGEFGGTIEETFLVTYDCNRLTIDILENSINASLQQYEKTRPNEQPLIELLSLSACQTATGEDSALGLAGLTIKVGARSVLATLWKVSSHATISLVKEFYDGIINHHLPKDKALQQAQRSLLEGNKGFKHPYYWSGLLLIGNWQ